MFFKPGLLGIIKIFVLRKYLKKFAKNDFFW